MSAFWEMVEFPEVKFLSKDDELALQHYKANTTRNESGKFTVAYPFNKNKDQLGDSFNIALKRFYSLEKRFKRDPSYKTRYIDTINEYVQNGHLVEVPPQQINKKGFFIPHQAVIKESSATTKFRWVLDASAPSSTGFSLNDVLLKGPNLTPEIFDSTLRFRLPFIAFMADIQKMYHAIYMKDEDTYYQQILWRENETDPIKVFRMIKVIFGAAPAAFLAIRTLIQLANEEKENFPIGSEILKNNFHVDNVATGADSIDQVVKMRDELINLLKKGGFNLRQWASNDERVIQSLPEESIAKASENEPNIMNGLGLRWNTETDQIIFQVFKEIPKIVTKRIILSDLFSLYFDPTGLTGPILVKFKIVMQLIWLKGSGWDEKLLDSDPILKNWLELKTELNEIGEITFDRKTMVQNPSKIYIHGFSDASEDAYGACIYVCSSNERGEIASNLICSKSRVAPLKKITLARLELCAALLLAKLLKPTIDALKVHINQIFLWSDSSITLQWISKQPYKLKTFVANRIAEIQSLTNPSSWRYVPSADNPADLVSRGMTPSNFVNSKLWFHGPEWLKLDQSKWPENKFQLCPLPTEEIKVTSNLNQTFKTPEFEILHKYSSIDKVTRIVAYILRFFNNIFRKDKKTGSFSPDELLTARNKVLFLTQKEIYMKEMNLLSKNKTVDNSSNLKNLNPFLDQDSLIRVGGRLKYASVLQEKNPIVLPKHHITDLIIRNAHLKNLHCGINATLNSVRFQYWPINGLSQVKKILKDCITCVRARPQENSYIMGNLPSTRVTPSNPFENTGVDYCGPFNIKEKKFRNKNSIKIYVSVFVCFTTKACHLEVVEDLTSESFIAALERFFARRDFCSKMYSDNGTNFVGANNDIRELQKFLASENHNNIVKSYLAKQGVDWHFIPPKSPHMGGLWEAAVKSFKRHLLRSIQPSNFTLSEFSTLTIKIEAILNSRPLTPLSEDPNDFNALTPGHFLIGKPLTSLPDPSLAHIKVNRLSNWQHVQYIKQQFWKRWQTEYLQELIKRTKWHRQSTETTKVGQLVTLKEDNTPPLCWPMGRIVEIHPGKDGVVRVVTVRTKDSVYKRNVKCVAILPID